MKIKIEVNNRRKFVNVDLRNYPLSEVVKRHTAFESFGELLNAPNNYRPSIYLGGKSRKAQCELLCLTMEYDQSQSARGDNRRVYRGDWS